MRSGFKPQCCKWVLSGCHLLHRVDFLRVSSHAHDAFAQSFEPTNQLYICYIHCCKQVKFKSLNMYNWHWNVWTLSSVGTVLVLACSILQHLKTKGEIALGSDKFRGNDVNLLTNNSDFDILMCLETYFWHNTFKRMDSLCLKISVLSILCIPQRLLVTQEHVNLSSLVTKRFIIWQKTKSATNSKRKKKISKIISSYFRFASHFLYRRHFVLSKLLFFIIMK